MDSERETMSRPVTPDMLEEVAGGVVEHETIERVLADTHWDYRRHDTNAGTAHVFARPVSLLESMRIDPADYQNHRHALGIGETDGEMRLTYLVLRDVHSDELGTLPRIESALRGRGRITRRDFSDDELVFVDRIWLPSAEIGEALGISAGHISTKITDVLRPRRLANRTELLVLGLKEGFLDPDLETWRRPDVRLSPLQSSVLRLAHLKIAPMARELGIEIKSANNALSQCYRKTGARTRGELVLVGLANGQCHLDELPTPEMEPVLTPLEQEMLAMADRSYGTIVAQSGDSKSTISNRYVRLYETLGLSNMNELVAYTFREGYIDNRIDPRFADVFSRRQRQVVERLMDDNDEIAAALGISTSVVVHHLVEAKRKAGVDARAELVAYGLRAGLIDPDTAGRR
ncbi:MAG: LuxR C-terminal-related transcriptional regulator [Patescibacteria group bacterium]